MAGSSMSGGAREPGHLERARLAVLRDEVGDRRLTAFIKAFLVLLDERLDRIAAAAPGAVADALRADRDLRVSCEMLGASQLAVLLVGLDARLRTGLPAADVTLADLRIEADGVATALSHVLDETDRR